MIWFSARLAARGASSKLSMMHTKAKLREQNLIGGGM